MGNTGSTPTSSSGGFRPAKPENDSQQRRVSSKDEVASDGNPPRPVTVELDFLQNLGKEIDTQVSTILNSFIGVPSIFSGSLPPGKWIIFEDENTPVSHSPRTEMAEGSSTTQGSPRSGPDEGSSPAPSSPSVQRNCPDTLGAMLQHSSNPPPFSQLEVYLRRSPYSPLILEQEDGFRNDCQHPAGRFWLRDAFEDLLRARSGDGQLRGQTRSEEDYRTEVRGRDWVRGVQGRWLDRWGNGRTDVSSGTKSPTSRDEYERFLVSAAGQGAGKSKDQAQAATPTTGEAPSSPDQAAPIGNERASIREEGKAQPVSTTTSTRRTIEPSGVIRTERTITQKYSDGRQEVNEEVTTDMSWAKSNTAGTGGSTLIGPDEKTENAQGVYAEHKQVTKSPQKVNPEKGWFWT